MQNFQGFYVEQGLVWNPGSRMKYKVCTTSLSLISLKCEDHLKIVDHVIFCTLPKIIVCVINGCVFSHAYSFRQDKV